MLRFTCIVPAGVAMGQWSARSALAAHVLYPQVWQWVNDLLGLPYQHMCYTCRCGIGSMIALLGLLSHMCYTQRCGIGPRITLLGLPKQHMCETCRCGIGPRITLPGLPAHVLYLQVWHWSKDHIVRSDSTCVIPAGVILVQWSPC